MLWTALPTGKPREEKSFSTLSVNMKSFSHASVNKFNCTECKQQAHNDILHMPFHQKHFQFFHNCKYLRNINYTRKSLDRLCLDKWGWNWELYLPSRASVNITSLTVVSVFPESSCSARFLSSFSRLILSALICSKFFEDSFSKFLSLSFLCLRCLCLCFLLCLFLDSLSSLLFLWDELWLLGMWLW